MLHEAFGVGNGTALQLHSCASELHSQHGQNQIRQQRKCPFTERDDYTYKSVKTKAGDGADKEVYGDWVIYKKGTNMKKIVNLFWCIVILATVVGCGNKTDKTNNEGSNVMPPIIEETNYDDMKLCIVESQEVKSLLEQYEMDSVNIKVTDSKKEADVTKLKITIELASQYVVGEIYMIAELSKWDNGWSLDKIYQDSTRQITFTATGFPEKLVIDRVEHYEEDEHYTFLLDRVKNNRGKARLFCNDSFDNSGIRNVDMKILDYTDGYSTVKVMFEFNYSYAAFDKSFCVPATAEFDSNSGFWKMTFYVEREYDIPNSKVELNRDEIYEDWEQDEILRGKQEILDLNLIEDKLQLYIAEKHTGLGGTNIEYKTINYSISEDANNVFVYDGDHGTYVARVQETIAFVPEGIVASRFYMTGNSVFVQYTR